MDTPQRPAPEALRERMFDDLTALASRVFDAPTVLITLADGRQRSFASSAALYGVGGTWQAPVVEPFSCETAIVVPDAREDDRFCAEPLVTGDPWVRFYAGAPLRSRDGHKLGTFCLLDPKPRFDFTSERCIELQRFATLTSNLIEQHLLEGRLHEVEERFVLATRASTDGIWHLDCPSGVLHCSARWNAILGLPSRDSHSRLSDWVRRIHPNDYDRVKSQWNRLGEDEETSTELKFRCRHQDGSWRWLINRVFCQRAKDGTMSRFTGSTTDITAAKMVDSLTGLHNRASLLEHLQWRIDRSAEHRRSYGLLFIDLDGFKRINDSLGHQRGDSLLVEIARRLDLTVASSGSLACRLGGDEFVIMIDDVEAAEDALTFASLLETLLCEPVKCAGHEVFVSASIGVVFGGSSDYTHAEQVLEDADLAMYRAKLHGKSQNILFSDTMRAEARERLQLEGELRHALENNELEVWYQPKVRMGTRQLKGFEALCRWRNPRRGLVSPAEFIPLAEEIGVISEIGRWVASQAISQSAQWRTRGLVSTAATMAVNVSARQFKEPDLLQFFQAHLDACHLPAACFIVEVTESVLVEDSAASRRLLDSIVGAGIGLDLDDFGTGYSSLSYLHRFPFRSVKIDRSFIGRMRTDPESVALVASIVALAHSMKMNTIAEGVEDEIQAAHLCGMGCHAAQGYLYSPPKPAGELEQYLRQRLAA